MVKRADGVGSTAEKPVWWRRRRCLAWSRVAVVPARASQADDITIQTCGSVRERAEVRKGRWHRVVLLGR